MELKASLKDYTQSEFQALVNIIWAVDLPKQDHDRLIEHFDRISEHPKGADLLFYPDDMVNTHSAESVVYHIRNWHHEKGRAAFKQEAIPAPVSAPSTPMTPLARSLAQVKKIAADVTVSDRDVETAFGLFEQGIQQLHGQLTTDAGIAAQTQTILTLEQAQHAALIAVRKLGFWKMTVEFAKSDAQRNLTYARSDQAQWLSVLEQIRATQEHYLRRLEALTQRNLFLSHQAEALLIKAQNQLVHTRSLAKVGNTISASLAYAHKRPEVLLESGPSHLPLNLQIDLQKSIRSAVAEFIWRNLSSEPTGESQCAAVLRFDFSSRADSQVYALSVPLVELMPLEGQDWLSLAACRAQVELPFRVGTTVVPAKPGAMFQGAREVKSLAQVYIAPAAGDSVRVRSARHDQQSNTFSFTTDGAAPITLCWSAPATLETTALVAQSSSCRLGFVQSLPVPLIEPLAGEAHTTRYDDYILVFPADSGLDPLYVTLSTFSLARTLALPAHAVPG